MIKRTYYNNKFIILLLSLISILFILNVSDVNAAASSSGYETDESVVAEKLYEIYGNAFGDENNLYTEVKNAYYLNGVLQRLHRVEASANRLQWGHLVYGYSEDARNVFRNTRWYSVIGEDRFVGLSVGGFYGYYTFAMQEDYATAGDTAERRYLDWRNHRNYVTGTNHGSKNGYTALFKYTDTVPWNSALRIRDYLNEYSVSDNYLSWDDAKELYHLWLEFFDDRYNPGNNAFNAMPLEKRKALAYIIQPPTEMTKGRFLEWHLKWNGSRYEYSNYLYDVYDIHKISTGLDFEAKKVEYERAGDMLNIYFTVKYHGKKDRILETQPMDTFSIYKNGSLAFGGLDLTNFPLDWKAGETKRVFIGSIGIGELRAGEEINTVATFNHTRTIEEPRYDNNTASAIYEVEPQQACLLGGSGTSKMYELWQCVDWDCDEDGCWCVERDCVDYYKSLSHNVSVLFNEDRQGLMGAWSSNSKGHIANKTKVPDAKKTDAKNEKWEYKAVSGNIPGVNKIKRVLRAGRHLEMYGTMEVEMRIQAFESSKLDTSQKAFVQNFLENLIAEGVEVGSGNGKVKNHLKKTDNTTDVDTSRTKQENLYIKYEKTPIEDFHYGSWNCTNWYIYEREYKFEVPIRTNNPGGNQQTSSSSDFENTEYTTGNESNYYYTNIDTMNGLHGLRFFTVLEGSSIDPGFSREIDCEAASESFAIQGNIYDDVVGEDVTDKVGKDNWDF